MRQGQGFRDKLYWRQIDCGGWCCFKKLADKDGGGYISLCGVAEIRKGKLGGQDARRPIPQLRCGICDGKEMARRGWEESGPTLHPKGKRSSVTVRSGKKGTSITFRGAAAQSLFKQIEDDIGGRGGR